MDYEDDDKPPSSIMLMQLKPRDFIAFQEAEKRDYFAKRKKNGLSKPKPMVSKYETYEAVNRVLDTGDRAEPALTFVAELMDKPEGWVYEVKSAFVPPKTIDTMLKDLKNHGSLVAMKETGLMSPSNKRGVKQSKTLSTLLNSLSDKVIVVKRIEALEERVEALEQGLLQVAEATIENKEGIENLCKLLHSQGLTTKEIAYKIGKSERTIRRYLQTKGD